jgi:hypothetical protein
MHFKKMAEAMGTVLTRGRRLLRKRWWPVGPKLVFDQIASPVMEIMDGPLYAQKKRGHPCFEWIGTHDPSV